MDRPGRFELFECHHPPISRGRLETPSQCAVGGTQAVDLTVGGAEEDTAARDGRRGVDAATDGAGPESFASVGINRVECVSVGFRHEQAAVGNDDTGQPASELNLPVGCELCGNGGR